MGHLYFCVFVGLLYREGDLAEGFSLEQGGGSFEGVCFFPGGGLGSRKRGEEAQERRSSAELLTFSTLRLQNG